MERTTIVHLMIERINEKREKELIEFPEDIRGDLIKEHNWGLFDKDGPKLMQTHNLLFLTICQEIDEKINDGTIIFNVEDGTITFQ